MEISKSVVSDGDGYMCSDVPRGFPIVIATVVPVEWCSTLDRFIAVISILRAAATSRPRAFFAIIFHQVFFYFFIRT